MDITERDKEKVTIIISIDPKLNEGLSEFLHDQGISISEYIEHLIIKDSNDRIVHQNDSKYCQCNYPSPNCYAPICEKCKLHLRPVKF